MRNNWHSKTSKETENELGTSRSQGLSPEEALSRLEKYGPNEFQKEKPLGFLRKLLNQFKSPLVYILLGAGVVTIFLERAVDSIVIFAALFINVVVGLIQEGRASKAFKKLNQSQEKHSKVIRNGRKQIVFARDLVPGDIVIVEAGDFVPADVRLVETNGLRISEAALTGESLAEPKSTEAAGEEKALADRENMAWMGTLVTEGFGKGIVVATGEETELGEIAKSLVGKDEVKTPLQRNVSKIARFILYIITAAIALIFLLGVLRGGSLEEMALVAIAIAVSAIPEGLPAAVTVVLAIGMERVLSEGGLVRSLLAAETLGSTTVILTDKTGTLTEAKMSLSSIIALDGIYEAGESGEPKGDLCEILELAVLTSDAFIEKGPEETVFRGRPLERAVLEAGFKNGIDSEEYAESFPRLDYVPFKSKIRYEASLNKWKEGRKMLLSGAPETLLDFSDRVLTAEGVVELSQRQKEELMAAQNKRSKKGERFIAVAYKDVDWDELPKNNERDGLSEEAFGGVVFAGLLSFSDPVRSDVLEAVETVRNAGAKVYMVTGDHPETALNIAKKSKIIDAHDQSVLSGTDIEKMNDSEVLEAFETTRVFARVRPAQKLRLVNLLRGQGEVVAMTGDGVNDAPALKNSDIGVAVESGTEVAKESSDLILLGNSFAIIVGAIREGRRIIDNLKKVLTHLLSTSFGEIFVITAAVGIGLPLPILPAQILWMNIIQEGLLNFAYAFEPAEKGVMKRDPRSAQSKNILTSDVKRLIFASGAVTGILMIVLFLLMLFVFRLPLEEIRTLVFVGLSLDAIVFAVSLKNMRVPLWRINPFTNKYLLGSLLVSTLLLAATLTVPFLKNLLSIADLSSVGLTIIAVVAVFDVLIIETAKYFLVYRSRK